MIDSALRLFFGEDHTIHAFKGQTSFAKDMGCKIDIYVILRSKYLARKT
jgi:hypothetical protein